MPLIVKPKSNQHQLNWNQQNSFAKMQLTPPQYIPRLRGAENKSKLISKLPAMYSY